MTYPNARVWLVRSSLLMIAGFGAFFIVAPALGFPLLFSQSLQMLQIVFPLFLGYAGSAVVFMFEGNVKKPAIQDNDLLSLLVKGPFFVSILLSTLLFLAFWFENSTLIASAEQISDFGFDIFSSAFSLILGIHTAITSTLVAYLFSQDVERGKDKR